MMWQAGTPRRRGEKHQIEKKRTLASHSAAMRQRRKKRSQRRMKPSLGKKEGSSCPKRRSRKISMRCAGHSKEFDNAISRIRKRKEERIRVIGGIRLEKKGARQDRSEKGKGIGASHTREMTLSEIPYPEENKVGRKKILATQAGAEEGVRRGRKPKGVAASRLFPARPRLYHSRQRYSSRRELLRRVSGKHQAWREGGGPILEHSQKVTHRRKAGAHQKTCRGKAGRIGRGNVTMPLVRFIGTSCGDGRRGFKKEAGIHPRRGKNREERTRAYGKKNLRHSLRMAGDPFSPRDEEKTVEKGGR